MIRKTTTVSQLQQWLGNTQSGEAYSGIFDYTFRNNPQFDYIDKYIDTVDGILDLNNGDLSLLSKFNMFEPIIKDGEVIEEDREVYMRLSRYLKIAIRAHEYELTKLIDTLDLQYNPIYNVEEHIVEKYIGDGTSKNDTNVNQTDVNKGNENTKTAYDTLTENTNTTINEHNDTTTGTVNDNFGRTAGQYTTSGNVAPFDSDVFHSNTQDINNHNEDARTDSHTTNSNIKYGEQSQKDTHTVNAHTDTATHTVDFTNTKNGITNQQGVTTTSYSKAVNRAGNVGVMSTQNMIQQERNIARFSIVEEICKIFIINFCVGYGVE